MARWGFAVLLAAMCIAPAAAQHLTVAQFRQTLAGFVAARKSDETIAKKCAAIELTEQLTPATRDAIRKDFQLGPKASLSLELLADRSGFLEPPADEIPVKDPPEADARKKMLVEAVQFAATTMHQMPNFLATRATSAFDDRPEVRSASGWVPAETPLHMEGTTRQQITYRDGREVPAVTTTPTGSSAREQSSPGDLSTTGEFGPLLSLVLQDSLNGDTTWSQWENVSGRLTAVYHFQIAAKVSHYPVNFCWQTQTLQPVFRSGGNVTSNMHNCYQGTPGYHGSIAIDPEGGAVMRIVIEADLPPSIALKRADWSIQYGTEEVGGQSYICPQSSVAISVVHYFADSANPSRDILSINETKFTDYRRFGSESRIAPEAAAQ